ncbi:MAG: hypothetical protein FJ096_13935 [Deltaproteobacteria bacterium]|nr:hypothetical protein [Deltaproteobacteria bacterium]
MVGRCAHARAVSPNERDASIGVRCCAGEVNTAEVELEVVRQVELTFQRPTPAMADKLERLVPEELRGTGSGASFHIERSWTWHPVGNEELHVGGGCGKRPGAAPCGVVIARLTGEGAARLAWVSSDQWIATVGRFDTPRGIYVYGGDSLGAFRKPVMFDWGMISEGRKERKKGSGWVRPVE